MFITEISLKLDPPQSSLRPWHGHRRRSASIGAEPLCTPQDLARVYTKVMWCSPLCYRRCQCSRGPRDVDCGFDVTLTSLDFHLANVDSIPTGPTHGEGRLQPHPGDGLNLEGRLSDPQFFHS